MGVDRYFDIVLCIDGTNSMNDIGPDGKSRLDGVKETAKNIGPYLYRRLRNFGCSLAQLRIRIIVYRDYLSNGGNAMLDTKWFTYPDELRAFESCIDSITASGGGDFREDGLEALAYAIKSDWTNKAPIRRHIIVVWTDADTHELGNGKSSQYYPRGMPKDDVELTAWWDSMNEVSKRLILFAPDESHWNYISDNWDNVIHYPSLAGQGITDRTFDDVFSSVVAPDF